MGKKHLAFKLRMQERKVHRLLGELKAAKLIDEDEQGVRMHDWHLWQYNSDVSTERVKQHRKRKRNVSPAVSETETKRPQIQSTDSEVSTSAEFLGAEPIDEDSKARLFRLGKTVLVSFGVAERRTGALIGQWLKSRDDPVGLLAAIQFARDQNVADPVAYISAVLKGKSSNGTNRQSLGDLARELADEARQLELDAGIRGSADPFGSH